MKFSLARFLVFPFSRRLAFLVAAILLITTTAYAQIVDIPDPNLERAIQEGLGIPAEAPVDRQELLRLTSLNATEKNIIDLTGLEHAANLDLLSVEGNQITDISSLASLTSLTHLNLADNTVENLEPLADLVQLQSLNLLNNRVKDLTPLANLTELTELLLVNNQITDITPLTNLTNLIYLYLTDNALDTLEPLAGLINLRLLDLYNAGVKDITPLANLAALESLVLARNMIVDISPLVGLKNLKELWIAENPIGDFSPLAELEGVELDLEIDFSRLNQLNLVVEVPDPNLRQVVRETSSLSDGAPLTQLEMSRLTDLEAWQRDITNLTGLQYAINLEYLNLWGNQIQDLTPLTNLTKLRELDLAYNAVESVQPLAGLIQLRTLNLTINRVQDITPLANLINLERLYIRENLVTDITSLQGLNFIEFEYDEVCDLLPFLPPVGQRIESRSFPSVFQAWDPVLGLDHLPVDERVALHDLHFTPWFAGWDQTPTEPFEGIATSLGGNLTRGRQSHQQRIDQNSNMIFLFSISLHSDYIEAFPPDSDLLLKDENGEIITGDGYVAQIDFLKSEVQDLLVKRIIAIARCGLYDGVMIDEFLNHGTWASDLYSATEEEIIQAILNIFRSVRSQVRDDFLILVNANRTKATRYTEYVNGTFMETGSDNEYLLGIPGGYTHDGLKEIESTLVWSEENLRSPQINCLEGWGIPAESPDSPENRRWMRVITTLSLTHSDGYVMYNTGTGAVRLCDDCPDPWGPGHEHIWYDFWDADLGHPVGPKAQHHQNIEGLFIREFTNGWAVYNRSEKAQTITLPASATPVSDRGNDAASQTHLLPDLDGEIYLKVKNPADVNSDGQVNILDLVQVANNFGKSDPDLNNDGVVNILDLTLVVKQFSQ